MWAKILEQSLKYQRRKTILSVPSSDHPTLDMIEKVKKMKVFSCSRKIMKYVCKELGDFSSVL